MIEAEVHKQLYAFLKHEGEAHWPHHLTIARLVARALRLDRSAFIQISPSAAYQGRYRLSYLVPLFGASRGALLITPQPIQTQLLFQDIPRFRDWTRIQKPVYTASEWPGGEATQGLLLLTPSEWLKDILKCQPNAQPNFPQAWPRIIDGAEQLDTWVRDELTVCIGTRDWEQLMLAFPAQGDCIRTIRAQLTQQIFQHPDNPYASIRLDSQKRSLFETLLAVLQDDSAIPLPRKWERFKVQLNQTCGGWIDVDRATGGFATHIAPETIAAPLQALFQAKTTVLIGSGFGLDPSQPQYRKPLGLEDATYINFAAERPIEEIQLYLPDRLPMPNTSAFQAALYQTLQALMTLASHPDHPKIVLVDDVPLKAQVTAYLAAILGARVSFETTEFKRNSIIVMGWQFWLDHHATLHQPSLLVMSTLPIPSPENPKVAAQIAYHKIHRQDWFKRYLLPTAIQTLQKAIAPIRNQQTIVAILDNRLLHRSYGNQILAAISPYARINYVDVENQWRDEAWMADGQQLPRH